MDSTSPSKYRQGLHPYIESASPSKRIRPSPLKGHNPPANPNIPNNSQYNDHFSFSGGSSSLFPKKQTNPFLKSSNSENIGIRKETDEGIPKATYGDIGSKRIHLPRESSRGGFIPLNSSFTYRPSEKIPKMSPAKINDDDKIRSVFWPIYRSTSNSSSKSSSSRQSLSSNSSLISNSSLKSDNFNNSIGSNLSGSFNLYEDPDTPGSVTRNEKGRQSSSTLCRKPLSEISLFVDSGIITDESFECSKEDENSPDFLPPTAKKVENGEKPTGSFSVSALADRKDLYPIEYCSEILSLWRVGERKVRPLKNYMEKQPDISHRMRTILVDWLVEVGVEYDLQQETLFLAVSAIDRFLSKMSVARNKLQLIGTAALFIASKYEEIQPPNVSDFVFVTDETYTKLQVLKMEQILLRSIEFALMIPTAYDFARAFAVLLGLDSQTTCLALYFTELSLLDGERYLGYLPSVIASAAIGLARLTFHNTFWDFGLGSISKYEQKDVQRCAQHLFNSFYDAPTSAQTATFEKYKSSKFCSIALTLLPSKLPWVC